MDQRGTGKSAAAVEPVATLTVEQAVSDTVEVSEWLRRRFGESRIYLVCSSWGTAHMVDLAATDKLMYAEGLAYATRTGHDDFADRLRAIGPPPYTDMLDYPVAICSNPDRDDYTPGPTTTRDRPTRPACSSPSTR